MNPPFSQKKGGRSYSLSNEGLLECIPSFFLTYPYCLMYCFWKLSIDASASSAFSSFFILSMTSSVLEYTISRIASRIASDLEGKSSNSTRKSSARRYRLGRRIVTFSESSRLLFPTMSTPEMRTSNRYSLTYACRTENGEVIIYRLSSEKS